MNTQSEQTTQDGVDQTDNSNYYETRPLIGTPYTMVKREGETFAAIGNVKLTLEGLTEEKIEEKIRNVDWDVIIPVIGLMIEKITNQTTNAN